MKIKIWELSPRNFELEEKGYIEAEEFHADNCWHLCNWDCWTDEKPENLHSDLYVVNSDVIFYNPKENKYYLALSVGWCIKDTLEEIVEYRMKK